MECTCAPGKLKNPEGTLMTYATASLVQSQGHGQNVGESCSSCNDYLEPQAKFCGSCGFIVAPNSFNINEFPEQQARLIRGESSTDIQSLPAFALPSITEPSPRAAELNEEAQKIMLVLARERIFLYFLIGSFLAINLFGCWASWTCYTGFIGDEMSKMMIAFTPFLFINLLALVVIVPIRGTRAEIARLKERLSHNRFNIEYGHLNM